MASLWAATGLNAIASSFVAVLISRGDKLGIAPGAATLAAWFYALWYYEAIVSLRLWESGISALLLLAILFKLAQIAKSPTIRGSVEIGALAGVAALFNTTTLALVPLLFLWVWLAGQPHRAKRRAVAVAVAVWLCVVAPWVVRCYVEFGHVMPLRDNAGLELWVGNHEGVTHLYKFSDGFPLNDPSEYVRLGELPFMDAKRDEALRFIERHPAKFAHLTGERIVDFWSAPHPSVWGAVSVFCWFGLAFWVRKNGVNALPFVIVMIVFPFVYYLTHTSATYRYPIEPVMLLVGIGGWWKAVASKAGTQAA